MLENRSDRSAIKGLAAGLVGGLVASWVMSNFQTLLSQTASALKEKAPEEEARGDTDRRKEAPDSGRKFESAGQQDEPATVKAAEALSEHLFHHTLTASQKKLGGPVMHYAMGITNGAVYGMLCESEPSVSSGGGLLFGASVWGLADNLVVPSLGLSNWPAAYPASTHAYSLVSHLVYGVTAELVRRIVRRVL